MLGWGWCTIFEVRDEVRDENRDENRDEVRDVLFSPFPP